MAKKKVSKKKIEKKESSKDESPENRPSNENKILKYTLIISAGIIVLILAFAVYFNSLKHFEYKGVEFETVSFGDLVLYQTSIPVIYEGKQTPYNIYFRTKPTKLGKIPFPEENFSGMKYTVINIPEEIDCEGYETIAIANFVKVHEVAGGTILKDENASCDDTGRYAYVTIKSSDETKVTLEGKNCYNLEFADCEILPITEKYLVELLSYKLS